MSAFETLDDKNIKVGMQVFDRGRNDWIITDVIGDGKFKAVQKDRYDAVKEVVKERGLNLQEEINKRLDVTKETFDISGKVDTNNPIYKFYDKEVAKYLRNKYGAKEVIDENGVKWMEVSVDQKWKNTPVEAFGLLPFIGGAALLGEKD